MTRSRRPAFALAFAVSLIAVPATAAPHPAGNAPAPEKSAVNPAAKTAALELARLLYSEESQVAIAERMVDTDMAAAFRANPDFQALEIDYPGVTDAVLKEMKPVLIRYTRAELPTYYDRVATLIASRLDAAEIADLTQFYQTPLGQKLRRGMQDNVTVKAMLTEVTTEPDKPTSYSAVDADHRAATDAAKKLIDKGDEPALIAFAKKPYFARLAAMGPAMRKLEQDFMNEPAPEFEAEIEAIVKATFARFEAAGKKK
ncbi:MAG TPA: DUF2059 domain-containing protein [Sphingomicrobium sp.]|nr:DUF2059 domain-containing protein [Sphingomicrobium sp.]